MRLLVVLLLVAPAWAQDIAVVTPKEFVPALADWKTHRTNQGHAIIVLAPETKEIPASVKHLLIVGDQKQVPAAHLPSTIINNWEKDPRIFSDNFRADRDGDHLPDMAVGRIPADSPDEAKAMLAKVIAYENNRDFGTWRRRINVVAGVGGFGERQDAAIEAASTNMLKNSIPASFDVHVTYATPNSPFCPPPARVRAFATERFEEGCLFYTYIGHGFRLGFDRMAWKGSRYRIFGEDDAAALEVRRGMPIAFLLCCSTGHFDGAPDCIAEILVKRPKGPVSVIASSRVSMPYGNAALAKELMEAIFVKRTKTVGEALRIAKLRSMDNVRGDDQRNMIETFATLLYQADPKKRETERIEHLYLYNLLGDPSMRIQLPEEFPVKARIHQGKLQVKLGAEPFGKVRIELARQRSGETPMRTDDSDEAFEKAYDAANRWVVASWDSTGGTFELPEGLRRNRFYDVRVWVESEDRAALGTARVRLP
ncbi:MAG: C25 family cysteine peptidase [Planctomycetota bacterium]